MQKTKSTPLKKAAENGHTQTVKTLLEEGANRNYQDKVRKHTKLHSLSIHGVVQGLSLHISLLHVYSPVRQCSTIYVQDDAVNDDISTKVCTELHVHSSSVAVCVFVGG